MSTSAMRLFVIIASALGALRFDHNAKYNGGFPGTSFIQKSPEVAVVEFDPELDSGRAGGESGEMDLSAIRTALDAAEARGREGRPKELVSQGGGEDFDALLGAVQALGEDRFPTGRHSQHRQHRLPNTDFGGEGESSGSDASSGSGDSSGSGSGRHSHSRGHHHGPIDEEIHSGHSHHSGHKKHTRSIGDDDDASSHSSSTHSSHSHSSSTHGSHSSHSSHSRSHSHGDDNDADIGTDESEREHQSDDESSGESSGGQGLTAHKMQFSIVRIASTARQANLMEPWRKSGEDQHFVGSGFIIHNDEEGPLIATNAHVISDAHTVCIVLTAKDKTCYRSQVRLVNHEWDLAFLMIIANDPEKKSNPEDPLLNEFLEATTGKDGKSILTVLEIHSKHFGSTVEQGTQVIALGFPLGKQSLALTSGVLSGSEVVHDVIVLQTTAPISPGNSGGPLLINEGPHKGEICGVNFASAVAQGSQNNNFAIPAWRLQQQFAFFKSRKDRFTEKYCQEDIGRCEMKVPVPSTETGFIPGNEILYKASGCDDSEGVFVTDVGERTSFAKADPPITGGMLIVSVDGTKIDRFGYGRNTEYLDKKVSFMDLVNFKQDLDQATTVTTCGCWDSQRNRKQEHSVSHEWLSAYETPLLDQPQVALAQHDFLNFAGIAMQPLSTALARELIITRQQLNLVPYAMKTNNKCPIVITKVDMSASSKDNNAPVVGAVVSHINGIDLSTLAVPEDTSAPTSGQFGTGRVCAQSMQRLRMAFAKIIDKSGSSCQSRPFAHSSTKSSSHGSHGFKNSSSTHHGPDESTIESLRYDDSGGLWGGDSGGEDGFDGEGSGRKVHKQEKNISYAHVNHIWTLKTQEGHFLAVDFDQALKDMSAVSKLAIDKTVFDIMKERGIELNETAAKEAEKREEEREQEAGGFGDPGGGEFNSGDSGSHTQSKGTEKHRHHHHHHRHHHSLSELMSREGAELDGAVVPIEYRNVYRGGMTAARDLEYALESPRTIWGASSFMEINEASVGPARMSQMDLSDPTSFLEINAANEMGPGGVEPESLMQVERKMRRS